MTGQAVPSYGPQVAGRYFKKLECFCFRSQTLAPGEVREMPVVFVIDPGLPADVNTMTLSYTFFEVEGRAKRAPADVAEAGMAAVSEAHAKGRAAAGGEDRVLVVPRHPQARGPRGDSATLDARRR